jgi:hypothetical protein
MQIEASKLFTKTEFFRSRRDCLLIHFIHSDKQQQQQAHPYNKIINQPTNTQRSTEKNFHFHSHKLLRKEQKENPLRSDEKEEIGRRKS